MSRAIPDIIREGSRIYADQFANGGLDGSPSCDLPSRFQPIDAGGLKSWLHNVLQTFAKCKFANYVAHLRYLNSTVKMAPSSASDGRNLQLVVAVAITGAGQRAGVLARLCPFPSYGNTNSHIVSSPSPSHFKFNGHGQRLVELFVVNL